MPLRAVFDSIVVKPAAAAEEKKSPGGLLIPGTARPLDGDLHEGVVISVGQDVGHKVKKRPGGPDGLEYEYPAVKPGERVLYRGKGTAVVEGGEAFAILKPADVLVVIEPRGDLVDELARAATRGAP